MKSIYLDPNKEKRAKNQRKILTALETGEKTFKQLRDETRLSEPTLSKHLKKLEDKEIIKSARLDDKRRVAYSLVYPPTRIYELHQFATFGDWIGCHLSDVFFEYLILDVESKLRKKGIDPDKLSDKEWEEWFKKLSRIDNGAFHDFVDILGAMVFYVIARIKESNDPAPMDLFSSFFENFYESLDVEDMLSPEIVFGKIRKLKTRRLGQDIGWVLDHEFSDAFELKSKALSKLKTKKGGEKS